MMTWKVAACVCWSDWRTAVSWKTGVWAVGKTAHVTERRINPTGAMAPSDGWVR